MAGVGEFYYELRVARRGDAAADEATLRRESFIKKLQERALFFQGEGGIRIVLERPRSCLGSAPGPSKDPPGPSRGHLEGL